MFGVASAAAIVLLAGPAAAHECYNTSRSSQGDQSIAAHAPTYVTFNQDAFLFLDRSRCSRAVH